MAGLGGVGAGTGNHAVGSAADALDGLLLRRRDVGLASNRVAGGCSAAAGYAPTSLGGAGAALPRIGAAGGLMKANVALNGRTDWSSKYLK